MQIPFSVMAQQLSLDVLHKRKCSNNIDEIIKKASHFKKVIPQTSEASQCYMTALDTWFDRYPKRIVKRSKRCHLDSCQAAAVFIIKAARSTGNRKGTEDRHRLWWTRQKEDKLDLAGNVQQSTECKADPSLEHHTFSGTNDLQEHWESWLEVGRHACAWHGHVKCVGQDWSRKVSEEEAWRGWWEILRKQCSQLRLMSEPRVANAPQTRLLHVVCILMSAISSVVSDMWSNIESVFWAFGAFIW